ncbi:ABC transporter ATP-binding protein [Pumilibacter intestinalis]|uniref:ABC transporter ATP-binding protein n=1 Tax=Pumilibacter intestinalis TaxID=2941511 RepID=UPI0020414ABB|nr:ABC transporter ATP-binding protein [Pumilibacter intestinalis]
MKNKKGFLKRFLPYYKPYAGTLALDLFCALLFSLSGLAFPVIVRELLNRLASDGSVAISAVLILGAVMVAVKLLETACRYVMITLGHIMGTRFEADLRRELYGKLMTMPASFYDRNKVGDLMSRVNNDLFDITEFSHHCPEELFIAGVRIIGIFVYLMFINVYLTLIIFASLPLFIALAFLLNGKLDENFKARRKKVGEINANIEDALSGISVVRSFGNEDVEMQKFERDNREFIEVKSKSYKIMGLFFGEVTFSTGLLYILTIVAGTIFIAKGIGGLDWVDLMTYVLFVQTLYSSIDVIITYSEQFQMGKSGFNRFAEIMDTPNELTEPQSPVTDTDYSGDIKLENVTFAYSKDGKDVLSNVNVTVESGTSVALVGPSGAGKTTIANLIPRLYDVKGGAVTIGGASVADIPLGELRKNVGIVQQNVYLFNGTVRENILYGKPGASEEQMIAAAKAAGAHEFIEKLEKGYDTECGERGVRLSGGQKQRISIARLFLKNPPVLILDEATSALDNESERVVQKSLSELCKGRTSIVIAHRLTTIRNADKIYVITEDGVAEQGTHSELMAAGGIYKSLYTMYEETA